MLLGYFNLRYQSQTREVRCAHRECDSTESYFADYPASSKIYGGHFPIWVIIEFFSVGMLSFTFSDLRRHDRKEIARLFHTGDNQLASWLRAFTELRNQCAHFARLYYLRFTSVPKKDRRMEKPVDRTLFSQIYMLKFLHQDAAKWNGHLQALASLMHCYEAAIDLEHIGFPTNWQDILTKR